MAAESAASVAGGADGGGNKGGGVDSFVLEDYINQFDRDLSQDVVVDSIFTHRYDGSFKEVHNLLRFYVNCDAYSSSVMLFNCVKHTN